MSICQECGSKVTAEDAYCPYCGIKVQHADAPPVEAEPAEVSSVDADMDSMESTIAISPEELARLQNDAGASRNPDEVNVPMVEEVSMEDLLAPKEAARRSNTVPTLEDIPLPAILASGYARPTDPNVYLDKEAEDAPVAEIKSTPAGEPEGEPIPAVEVKSPEPDKEVPASVAVGDIPENVESVSYEAAPIPVEVIEEPQISSEAVEIQPESGITSESDLDASSSPEMQKGSTSVTEVEEPGDAEEEVPQSISKPLENLEEPAERASIFDSVRIMEGDASMQAQDPDLVKTVVPGRLPVVSSPLRDAEADSAPADESPVITDSGLGTDNIEGKPSGKLKPLPEGTILNGRYEIVRKIGGGGMGAIYLASDNNLGGVLRAVKEMVQSHIEEEQQEKAVNDFKRESMILSTLDHPSIPTIYDYFYDASEGRFYLVMKYISGGDLASKLRAAPDGKIDELTITEWAIQITDVLNYLHNQPTTIVYRDLKPSNLMLDGNSGRVMIIDFGIARSITQKEEKGVTAVGTMGYAPPELFSGNVEPRSDIYSLGSTMFHLLTGADPQSNPLLIFDFQKNPRPRQINSRLSDQMERILMRSVEYNADARYSSAAEMKAVLEDHLANLRSGNLSYGVTEAPISVSLANQSVFCGFCGQRIVATDLFCAFCGAKQPLAQQGVHSEIYHKAQMTARLVIEGTSELSAPIYALQKDDNLIGRRDPMSNIFPEVDLSKYDPQTKISRRHAKIWRDGTSFMLEDLGSSNGTVVEGTSLNSFRLPAHQPYKLTSGDRIKIGDASLHFVLG